MVEQPPTVDTTFHFPMEGHAGSLDSVSNHPTNDTGRTKYGPNAPFWRNSLGQSIYEYGINRPSFVNPFREAPSNEEIFIRIQPSIDHLCNAQENLTNITVSPLPHRAPMSSLLPHLPEITLLGYHSLSLS